MPSPYPESVICGEDLPYLAGGVVHQHVPGGRVSPPLAERGIQHQTRQHRNS
jgi:hypothetical protein